MTYTQRMCNPPQPTPKRYAPVTQEDLMFNAFVCILLVMGGVLFGR